MQIPHYQTDRGLIIIHFFLRTSVRMPRMTSSILEFLQTPVCDVESRERKKKGIEWIMRSKPLLGYRELCAQVRQWVKKVICVWCVCVCVCVGDGFI